MSCVHVLVFLIVPIYNLFISPFPLQKTHILLHWENLQEQLFVFIAFSNGKESSLFCADVCVWSELGYSPLGMDGPECSFAHPISQERALATAAC